MPLGFDFDQHDLKWFIRQILLGVDGGTSPRRIAGADLRLASLSIGIHYFDVCVGQKYGYTVYYVLMQRRQIIGLGFDA
jgi:hypothetical protein